ncbi:MAG: hypothetical protein HFF79_04405 [Oscillospiraceae bacterium]|nr:hypothetical protein [Oscillospiraceae bacterium]
MLTIQLTGCDGSVCQLPTLIQWEFSLTGGVPCDSMTAVCLYDDGMAQVLPKATRFLALQDGKTVLRGVVDAYEISLSERGLLVTVEGRGMAALLLDNESEAVSYERADLDTILRNHVAPYGIRTERRQAVYGDGYVVSAGSSQWRAVRDFTHRRGGFEPCFTREGVLVAAPLWGSGRTIQVGDSTPMLSFSKREQRYGVISEVLIQDKAQGVSHLVTNDAFLAAGGCRRQVIYMPRSTADSRRYTGEYQIAQSALEQLVLTLELPLAFAAFPGDRVSLRLQRLGLSGTYDVTEVRCRMDGSGERTILSLGER